MLCLKAKCLFRHIDDASTDRQRCGGPRGWCVANVDGILRLADAEVVDEKAVALYSLSSDTSSAAGEVALFNLRYQTRCNDLVKVPLLKER